jgi:hypothetical protein
MEFKTCIAEHIVEDGEDMWFYIHLSNGVRGQNEKGDIEFFEYLIILERIIDEDVHTVVMGCYDDEYKNVCSVPIIPNVVNGMGIEELMASFGYSIQIELH